MAAVLLSLVLAVMLGGVAWLIVGTRLRLDDDTAANELLNVLAYAGMAFPLLLVVTYIWAP